MGFKQVRKQSYCYESCHVTTVHCLVLLFVLAVFAHFEGKINVDSSEEKISV